MPISILERQWFAMSGSRKLHDHHLLNNLTGTDSPSLPLCSL
jgi:hypothetical protein